MALSEAEKSIYIETARLLKGSERRMFMARVVKSFGRGGQRLAAKELGWNRGTIRKGMFELEKGRPVKDKFSQRGRKPIEFHLPNLLSDIHDIIEVLKYDDSVYLNTRYYIGISAAQIRHHLINSKGYCEVDLPTNETIRVKMRNLNYRLRRY